MRRQLQVQSACQAQNTVCIPSDCMNCPCRVEVLGARISGEFLGGASAIQSAVDVHMWTVLGRLPVLHIKYISSQLLQLLNQYSRADLQDST